MRIIFRTIPFICAALAGCNTAVEEEQAQTRNSISASIEVSMRDYLDLEKCWTKFPSQELEEDETFEFEGALALFPISRNPDNLDEITSYAAVLFSSRCHLGQSSLEGGSDQSFDVGVNALDLSEIDNVSLQAYGIPANINDMLAPEPDMMTGTDPEFPVGLYAVRGDLVFDTSRFDATQNFDEIVIREIQALPPEMYGAFLGYFDDRALYVNLYFDPDFEYDHRGYRELGVIEE